MTPEFKRALGLRDLVLFNIAAVIGIRWLAAAAHAGPGSLTLWVLAAALFFVPSALAVATLGERYPDQGGLYVWTRRAFGPWHGFLCGWCYWLSNLFYLPNLILAGLAMSAYALGLAEDSTPLLPASLAVLWIALIANLVGLGVGKWIGSLGAAATYVAGGLLLVLGAWAWRLHGSATPLDLAPGFNLDKLNFWSQIAFAFGGLELGAVMAGEIRDPRRTVPRAAWISGAAIAAFYILGTLAMLVLRTPDRISPLTGLVEVGADAGVRLGLAWAAPVLALAIALNVTGQLGAWIGAVARVPFAIGLDRYLPAAFARLHPRYGTPHVALLVLGAVATAFVLTMQAGETLRVAYQLLVDLTVMVYFIPFLYLFAAAWREGRWFSGACGTAVTVAAIVLSLIPPGGAASVWLFELKLVGGCLLLVAAARLCFKRSAAIREPAAP